MTDDNTYAGSDIQKEISAGNFSKVRDQLLIRSGEIKMGLQLVEQFTKDTAGQPEPVYITELRDEFTQAKTMNDFSLTMVELFMLKDDTAE